MEAFKNKKVLISGASIAGLSCAWWMNNLGYSVTVVEVADQPRTAGSAIDIRGNTVDVARRMGIHDELEANKLNVEQIIFKNAADVSERTIVLNGNDDESNEVEIERDKFINMLFAKLKNNVEFIFSDSIAVLNETGDNIKVTFKSGAQRAFDLVLGCDGSHSGVRKLWFGPEADYAHFMEAYFSITIVDKLLVEQNTMQMFNVPNKAVMLNAYKNKTDVIFCFHSQEEISYSYRDIEQQRNIILEHFSGESWRTAELLEEVRHSGNFYFDKFCQIKMPSWSKGRVVLVGDAAYCASPAAGMGASLSMIGAAALADALVEHGGDHNPAFATYEKSIRPFIEEVQGTAEKNVRENFIPRTEEAIRERNEREVIF
ncbi:FAD-binding monooxygenase [Mucilaginibacter terrenus]|uniref:FAD-binding monooxygenase n=1 Tax=Mucilaginibacter terrenus TaxID=2482727 RepID=A0A3E2NT59_9SPHI|nr:FAD-dependent monooxygenase [Mucilaginibacter terrenus]RFZ84184.1 FAD-binding monooxygenase [Mucilaginibacter terrenus]